MCTNLDEKLCLYISQYCPITHEFGFDGRFMFYFKFDIFDLFIKFGYQSSNIVCNPKKDGPYIVFIECPIKTLISQRHWKVKILLSHLFKMPVFSILRRNLTIKCRPNGICKRNAGKNYVKFIFIFVYFTSRWSSKMFCNV